MGPLFNFPPRVDHPLLFSPSSLFTLTIPSHTFLLTPSSPYLFSHLPPHTFLLTASPPHVPPHNLLPHTPIYTICPLLYSSLLSVIHHLFIFLFSISYCLFLSSVIIHLVIQSLSLSLLCHPIHRLSPFHSLSPPRSSTFPAYLRSRFHLLSPHSLSQFTILPLIAYSRFLSLPGEEEKRWSRFHSLLPHPNHVFSRLPLSFLLASPVFRTSSHPAPLLKTPSRVQQLEK